MLRYIFIIAVALPALSRGESTNQTSLSCYSNPNVTAAANKMEEYLNETFKSGWKSDTGKKIKFAYNDFMNVTAITCNQSTEHRNTAFYLDSLKYVFTSDYLADFVVNNTGRRCVAAARNDIEKCVNKYVVDDKENHANNNSKGVQNAINLWKYSMFIWNMNSCNITHKVKKCTIGVIKNINVCKSIENFVVDLFNGVSKNCEGIVKEESTGPSDFQEQVNIPPQKGPNNTINVLILVIVVLGAIYVLIRDWKFSMLPCSGRGGRSPEATELNQLNQGTRTRHT